MYGCGWRVGWTRMGLELLGGFELLGTIAPRSQCTVHHRISRGVGLMEWVISEGPPDRGGIFTGEINHNTLHQTLLNGLG